MEINEIIEGLKEETKSESIEAAIKFLSLAKEMHDFFQDEEHIDYRPKRNYLYRGFEY